MGDVKKKFEHHDIEVDDQPDGGANALNVYRLFSMFLKFIKLFDPSYLLLVQVIFVKIINGHDIRFK